MRGELVHLGFGEAGNGAEVYPAVAVFGKETNAEVFHFVAGSDHQSASGLRHGVEGGHPQPGARVGQCQKSRLLGS